LTHDITSIKGKDTQLHLGGRIRYMSTNNFVEILINYKYI